MQVPEAFIGDQVAETVIEERAVELSEEGQIVVGDLALIVLGEGLDRRIFVGPTSDQGIGHLRAMRGEPSGIGFPGLEEGRLGQCL